MIRLMIGRELKSIYRPPAAPPGEPHPRDRRARAPRPIPTREVDLAVRRGEILGLAGLIGAGRTELARAVFGIDPLLAGHGPPRRPAGRRRLAARRDRARHLPRAGGPQGVRRHPRPADRRQHRAAAAPGLRPRRPGRPRRGARSSREAERRRLAIRAPSVATPVVSLSGGNQQKVVLAKWLAMQPRVIIFDEPTRGIDVGAKREIYDLMRELADAGVGDPDDLQRHGGGDRRQRPHRGDARGGDQRHSGARGFLRAPGAASWPWATGE